MVTVAQWQSAGSLSQRPWVRLPAAPLFFHAFCHFKGLQTITTQMCPSNRHDHYRSSDHRGVPSIELLPCCDYACDLSNKQRVMCKWIEALDLYCLCMYCSYYMHSMVQCIRYTMSKGMHPKILCSTPMKACSKWLAKYLAQWLQFQ